ncbi:uncharacterized protein N7459_006884 [Penicillium hispanicum]|uniref:uncharacterized protein n=1 Tax=Penicillium hispanicum TaxID=1080232 RepID=UPI002541408F|nr:uncharacterized protein N7459_006884 [Penicillium hispanicum]KAJ5577920.1 hypothetical protein N7459_006884 [Penicillium hispanicum]
MAHDAPPTYTRYGDAETSGSRWQQWLDDPTDHSCIVSHSTLTVNDLREDGWLVQDGGWAQAGERVRKSPPPGSVWRMVSDLDLPIHHHYKIITILKKARVESDKAYYNDYVIQVGPGVIFALFSTRVNGPHWSEIALAVYRHYETADLRYVFRVDVVNDAAVELIANQLYTPANGLQWPDHEPKVWEQGTPEYRALLSTPPVRGVASVALGGFDRGAKHISGITTWAGYGKIPLQILVVLENRA